MTERDMKFFFRLTDGEGFLWRTETCTETCLVGILVDKDRHEMTGGSERLVGAEIGRQCIVRLALLE